MSPLGTKALPDLLECLTDAYAVNRVFGLVAIQKIAGRELTDTEYDLLAPPDVRETQVQDLKRRARHGEFK